LTGHDARQACRRRWWRRRDELASKEEGVVRFASWEREDAYLRSGSSPTQNACFLCLSGWSPILRLKTL
jgi:hypothetical protein